MKGAVQNVLITVLLCLLALAILVVLHWIGYEPMQFVYEVF